MKHIIKLFTPLLVLFILNSCDNEKDFPIVTDIQPGIYASGSATAYRAIAPAAVFNAAPIDTDADGAKPGMLSMYTWLKADGDLFIVKADNAGNTVNYGKGTVVTDAPQTYALTADAAGFKVPADGLYLIIYNSSLEQLTLLPASFGVIGGATAGGWNGITPFTDIKYNETTHVIEMKSKFTLTKGEMKFRFDGNANSGWGNEVPYDATGVARLHTNQGDAATGGEISSSTVELKDGGGNLAVKTAGDYEITLKYDMTTSKFTTSAKMDTPTGPVEPEPTYPTTLYMNGGDFGGTNWDWSLPSIVEMVPVNGVEGAFWCINYFTAANGFKWAPEKKWADDFAQLTEVIGYEVKDGNAFVPSDGLYMVYIDMKADKIAIEPALVYGIGGAFGVWDEEIYPFTITGNKASITTLLEGNLRMYAGSSIATTAWWTREFILRDGKIEYRGNGGDQKPDVAIEAGKTVTLDFKAGTGTIQ